MQVFQYRCIAIAATTSGAVGTGATADTIRATGAAGTTGATVGFSSSGFNISYKATHSTSPTSQSIQLSVFHGLHNYKWW